MAKDITVTQLRVPHELWTRVKHMAIDEDSGISANAMAVILISEALEARRAASRTDR